MPNNNATITIVVDPDVKLASFRALGLTGKYLREGSTVSFEIELNANVEEEEGLGIVAITDETTQTLIARSLVTLKPNMTITLSGKMPENPRAPDVCAYCECYVRWYRLL